MLNVICVFWMAVGLNIRVVSLRGLTFIWFVVEWKQNVVAHAQKPDLVFQRNGRVHFYRRGFQFSRLLAAEVCASAVVMLDRPCPIQGKAAGYPLHSPFSPSLLHPCVSVCHQFPFLLYLICWVCRALNRGFRILWIQYTFGKGCSFLFIYGHYTLLLMRNLYVLMPGRKHWGPDRMKVAVQSIPNKEMGPCMVARIASVLQNVTLRLREEFLSCKWYSG